MCSTARRCSLMSAVCPSVGGCPWGLDFAMLATFIGIVVPALRNQPQIAAALVAGAVALLCHVWQYKLGLMAAALSGITVGVRLERCKTAVTVGGGAGWVSGCWLDRK